MKKTDLIALLLSKSPTVLNQITDWFDNNSVTIGHRSGNAVLDLGEYFFDGYKDEWFFEDMQENFKEEFAKENRIGDDILLHTWSSKSGTTAGVEFNVHDDIVNELEYDLDREAGVYNSPIHYDGSWDKIVLSEMTHKQLTATLRLFKKYEAQADKELAEVEALKDKLVEWVRGYADGVRTGGFSNGEAIFNSINPANKGTTFAGKWEEPYYESLPKVA